MEGQITVDDHELPIRFHWREEQKSLVITLDNIEASMVTDLIGEALAWSKDLDYEKSTETLCS